jgi:TetR/AcrR family transcriptional repressor of nem operon
MKTDIDSDTSDARSRLLDAALHVIRSKGYSATSVDDICAATGVTKGSFFHHFRSKEEMTLAAIAHWNDSTGAFFAGAPHQQLDDPRDRVLGYIDLRKSLLRGEVPDYTCLLGTLVQETFHTHPRLREACNDGITRHARTVGRDIAAAKALHAPDAGWDPQALALFTQAALQGAFVLAKARDGATVARQCVDHLRQHVANLLGADARPAPSGKTRR